jgi:ribose transport system ATP-binding protein
VSFPPAALLKACALHKRYAAPVLVDFDFELQPGEVHALVGANGAGKSTFVRMLGGLGRPDGGLIEFDGRPHTPASRREAEEAGVVIVLQELNVIPTLTVAENLFLDRLPRRLGWIARSRLREQACAALRRVGLAALDPDTPAGVLGVGEQQLVEIASALARRCRLLILDEPTAALTGPETERLFTQVRTLRAAGTGIIYITHRMHEIAALADRVSVLRDGRRVVTRPASAAAPARLVADMVGREDGEAPPVRTRPRGALALRVEGLRAGMRVRGVDFEVHAGEVLGLAGLAGSGRTETLRAIIGADRLTGGRVSLGPAATPVTIRGPADAVRLGIGFVPEDRKKDGLLLPLSIATNTALASLSAIARLGWLAPAAEAGCAGPVCAAADVRCASLEQPVVELSGGNQQKVVLARWLARKCSVLLVDEPTRGIDVAAKQRLHALLRDLAHTGVAVVVVSSETSELFALCDRIAVLSAGRIAAELVPPAWSEAAILTAAFSGYTRAATPPLP